MLFIYTDVKIIESFFFVCFRIESAILVWFSIWCFTNKFTGRNLCRYWCAFEFQCYNDYILAHQFTVSDAIRWTKYHLYTYNGWSIFKRRIQMLIIVPTCRTFQMEWNKSTEKKKIYILLNGKRTVCLVGISIADALKISICHI